MHYQWRYCIFALSHRNDGQSLKVSDNHMGWDNENKHMHTEKTGIMQQIPSTVWYTVYPKKYAHGFVVLCFVVVMQSFIMNSHEVFFHIHQGCFAGTGAIVRLPQCQWSKPDGYGEISQCITTTKHSKAKTVCIFLGIYCIWCTKFQNFLSCSRLCPVHWSQESRCSYDMLEVW